MKIKPTLDKQIPKGYTYIYIIKPEYYQRLIDSLTKESKEKMTKSRKSQIKNDIERYQNKLTETKEKIQYFDSGQTVNLYFATEKIYDITRYCNDLDFNNYIIYKIKPIAMSQTWQNHDTYDLNAFIPIKKIETLEDLIVSLYEDSILENFVITYFSKNIAPDEKNRNIRHNFLMYIKENYPEYLFSMSDVYSKYVGCDYEYKSNKHRMKAVKDAYELGLINLYDKYRISTLDPIKMLLIEKEFDILDDLLNGLNDKELSHLKNNSLRSTKLINKLVMENSDNEVVKKLIPIMDLKTIGFVLYEYEYDDWEGIYVNPKEIKTFDTIDDLKRYIIVNYSDISLSKVTNGEFDDMYINNGVKGIKLDIKIME